MRILLSSLLKIIIIGGLLSQEIVVNSIVDLPEKLKNAQPGSVFVIPEGTHLADLTLEGYGAEGDSIKIIAQSKGKTIIDGTFNVKGEYLVISGFTFVNSRSNDIIGGRLTTINCEELKNSRISCNDFLGNGRSQRGTSDAVILLGNNSDFNKIDNNFWTNTKANCIYIIPPCKGNLIERNIFANTQRAYQNRWEIIKLNYNIEMSEYKLFTVIKNNLFYNYKGDGAENLSIKASNNYITNNLFVKCEGTLTLRQGSSNYVSGNIFYSSRGIRVTGENHTISNNQFVTNEFAIGIIKGDSASNKPKYKPVKNLDIINNSFYCTEGTGIIMGGGTAGWLTIPPQELRLLNNAFFVKNPASPYEWASPVIDSLTYYNIQSLANHIFEYDTSKVKLSRLTAHLGQEWIPGSDTVQIGKR